MSDLSTMPIGDIKTAVRIAENGLRTWKSMSAADRAKIEASIAEWRGELERREKDKIKLHPRYKRMT